MNDHNPSFKSDMSRFWIFFVTLVNVPLLLFMCASAFLAGTIFNFGYCMATIVEFGVYIVLPIIILAAIIFSWIWYRRKMYLASVLVSVGPVLLYLGALQLSSFLSDLYLSGC
jgi:hypothetical protein